MQALLAIFGSAPPRFIPFASARATALFYADAFFELGGSALRPSQADTLPAGWAKDWPAELVNGWGFVLLPADGSTPIYAHGSVPPAVLKRFAKTKAYIFVLEALAQLVPLLLLHPLLRGPFWAFIDNEAAKHALTKGYSGNAAANTLVSAYWVAAATTAAAPWMERVSSKANLSDQVSRGDFAQAVRLGWRRVRFDLERLWQELAHLVDSDSLEVGATVAAALRDFERQRRAVTWLR